MQWRNSMKRVERNIFIPDRVKITYRPMDVANNTFWIEGSTLDGNESFIKVDAARFLESLKQSIREFEEAIAKNSSTGESDG